jgi:peptidoglycan/xylan/chitin deacetylase (PgdA/CDA1 family)
MAEPSVLVLTYHSIGDDSGPTSIPADVFRRQMEELVSTGYRSLDLQGFIDWRLGRDSDPGRRVLITFDDGFADFGKTAFPIMRSRHLQPVMFVPTGKVGGSEDWGGANEPPRPLLSWRQIKALSKDGVEFGAHGVNHPDLTALSAEDRLTEIVNSGKMLEDALGKRTRSFAAPYGRVNKAVLADIAKHYELAFSVQFDRTRISCDPVNIPRIEMHYFRDPARWRTFLEGGEAYFQGRRFLRGVRNLVVPRQSYG